MAKGDKDKYTDKQKRKAEHIEGYEKRGVESGRFSTSCIQITSTIRPNFFASTHSMYQFSGARCRTSSKSI